MQDSISFITLEMYERFHMCVCVCVCVGGGGGGGGFQLTAFERCLNARTCNSSSNISSISSSVRSAGLCVHVRVQRHV